MTQNFLKSANSYSDYVLIQNSHHDILLLRRAVHIIESYYKRRQSLSKNESDVLKGLQNEMCHTKDSVRFSGLKRMEISALRKSFLRETIGGLWRDGAKHASRSLVKSVTAIKRSMPKSSNYKPPERFEYLERIVKELEKDPKLANSMKSRNKLKIQKYQDATDKIYDEMKKELLKIKIKAAEEAYDWLYEKERKENGWKKKNVQRALKTHQKATKCLEKGGDCGQREAKDLRDIWIYRHIFMNYRKKSTRSRGLKQNEMLY